MRKVGYSTMGFMDRDIHAALNAIASAGFNHAEILGIKPHVSTPLKGNALRDLCRCLSTCQLSCSVHAPMELHVLGAPEEQWRQEKVEVFSEYIRFAGEIGAKHFIIHPVPNPIFVENPDDPKLPGLIQTATRRSLDALMGVAEQSQVKLLLENLYYQCRYPFLNMTELRALVDLYPQEQLGLVLDTGHAAIHGDDVAKEIYIAGNRLGGVHLQDPNKELDYDEHSLPTRGGLDWDVIRIALADIKYAGAWTFEIHKTLEGETPEELASQCRKLATSWGCG